MQITPTDPDALLADPLLSERTVLERWPALSKCGLRAARQTGRIAWVRGKRGSAWYRPSAIEIFIINEMEQPCLAPAPGRSSRSAINGSLRNLVVPVTTATGKTQPQAEQDALASAQRILSGQKRNSSKA